MRKLNVVRKQLDYLENTIVAGVADSMQVVGDDQVVVDCSQHIPVVVPLLDQYLRSVNCTICNGFNGELAICSVLSEDDLSCV